MYRLELLKDQIVGQPDQNQQKQPIHKTDWFKQQGWGYKDTEFILGEDGIIRLTGDKYEFSGQTMPKFREWAEQKIGIDVNKKTPSQKEIPIDAAVENADFVAAIAGKVDEINSQKKERIIHSHGHTLQEIYALRHGKFERTVDYVVYVKSHEQVETVVQAATKFNVVLIPYGGGTNVTWALKPVTEEKRTIISVDMTRLNHVVSVDHYNMQATVQAGIIGKEMEAELRKYGLTVGHEPDSVEFSSLGGWISTRASGMKKNRYGNIEDILISVKIVTPQGTFVRKQNIPRTSSGPDVNQFILGSEGNFGVITEAVLKVRKLPEVVDYDSILFYDFESGAKFMYEVAMEKIWPASIRFMDNLQFQFGMALKVPPKSKLQENIDAAKKYFITNIKKFDADKMCLATICFEGSKDQVAQQKKAIKRIRKTNSGFRAGPENGQRGYFLTFVIAYLRDYGFEYGVVSESFETSCEWKNMQAVCDNTTKCIKQECLKRGVKIDPFISMRITQLYDTGCCIYIYFAINYIGLTNPVQIYEEIEDAARTEIMRNGGSISHHHGVGKLRKKFLKDAIGEIGINMIKSVKNTLDPANNLGCGNLI